MLTRAQIRWLCACLGVWAFFTAGFVYAETGKSFVAVEDGGQTVQRRRENLREELEQREAELAEKLSALNQLAASVLQTALLERNAKFVAEYTRHLNRLEKIMAKVSKQTALAQEAGEDIAQLREALGQASAAIEKARQAVAEQEKKTYQVDLASAESLRQAKVDAFGQFRDDHARLRDDSIRSAREYVLAVFEIWRTLVQ